MAGISSIGDKTLRVWQISDLICQSAICKKKRKEKKRKEKVFDDRRYQ